MGAYFAEHFSHMAIATPYKKTTRALRPSLQSGMTLVEMAVVVSIVAIVSAVIVFNYSSFRNNVTIRSLSQDIALAIRKAQTYATSVQAIDNSTSSTNQFPGFGISFSTAQQSSPNTATPSRKQFVLFADIADPNNPNAEPDGMYNNGGSCGTPQYGNECVESFSITTPDQIVELCTYDDGCFTSGTIDIVFDRPAPDANICVASGGSCDIATSAEIVVRSISAQYRRIVVWNTGQISVE